MDPVGGASVEISQRSVTGWLALLALLVIVGILAFGSWDAIGAMVAKWSQDEYSYSYFVPLLVAFFIWQKKNRLVARHKRRR